MAKNVLEVVDLTKIYPGTVALDHFNAKFESGKVHALIGKNGSGKSTFIKMISGAIKPTSGKILINDKQIKMRSPMDAFSKGIATVYQEMSLIPEMTVAENIFFGRLPKKGGRIDWKALYQNARELLRELGVDIPEKAVVSQLSVWQQQTVEIAKAMSYHPSVMLLDEPTSALAQQEVELLFEVIRNLKSKDVIVIYISHKLQELRDISDTVTVIRDGKYIGQMITQEASHNDILDMMFGDVELKTRPVDLAVQEEVVLEVKNLTREPYFRNVSFRLRKGEILGIAGMLGSGRTELLRAIFGADPFDSGQIVVDGKCCNKMDPQMAKKLGIALTPENRKTEGLIQMASVRQNLVLASLDKISRWGIVQKAKEREAVDRQIEELQIKIPGREVEVSSLSGGNQQKVVVGNWLNNSPKILILDEPSRGIDVNAKQQIFQLVWDQSKRGISSIMVSSELEEVVEVCHRILIMRQGEIRGEIGADEIQVNDLYAMCMEEIG